MRRPYFKNDNTLNDLTFTIIVQLCKTTHTFGRTILAIAIISKTHYQINTLRRLLFFSHLSRGPELILQLMIVATVLWSYGISVEELMSTWLFLLFLLNVTDNFIQGNVELFSI